jgi:hypothetical protein
MLFYDFLGGRVPASALITGTRVSAVHAISIIGQIRLLGSVKNGTKLRGVWEETRYRFFGVGAAPYDGGVW